MIAPSLMLLSGIAAAAVPDQTVRLGLGDCVPSRDLVHDLVAIEIGFERLIDRTEAAIEVRVECRADQVVIALAPASRGVPARVIALSEVEKRDGARLVALNIVELLNTPATKVEVGEPATAPRLRKKSAPPAIELAPRGGDPLPHRFRVAAAPGFRYQPSPGRFAYGARASLGIDAPRGAPFPWTLHFGGGVEQSQAKLALGSIKTRVAAIALGAGERLEITDDLSIFGLIGASGGYAKLDADAGGAKIIARSGSGWWLGPMLAARVRYGARAGISLGVEGGLITREVYGELPGGEKFGQRGAWLGLELALDWSL